MTAIALTIAGSDSGGGAGIQADLKTFSSLQVHGTSVITCITAQNPREVRAVQPIKSTIVLSQLEAIYAELKPAVAKTGIESAVGAECDVVCGDRGFDDGERLFPSVFEDSIDRAGPVTDVHLTA